MTLAERLNNEIWCKLAPSSIHGIGVFAIRDIPKGTEIFAQSTGGVYLKDPLDDVLPEIKALILQRWPLAEQGYAYLSPNDDARLLSFMNHSKEPNYDPVIDCVLRDITAGEEITEDYGEYGVVYN